MAFRKTAVCLAITAALLGSACASSPNGGRDNNENMDLITREQILEAGANNLYDVVSRLRPRWLQVRSLRSFNQETEIVVLQNEMLLGGPEALREMTPELAYEVRYLDGTRAAAQIPGLMSGRHIQGAIVVSTRPKGGG